MIIIVPVTITAAAQGPIIMAIFVQHNRPKKLGIIIINIHTHTRNFYNTFGVNAV